MKLSLQHRHRVKKRYAQKEIKHTIRYHRYTDDYRVATNTSKEHRSPICRING